MPVKLLKLGFKPFSILRRRALGIAESRDRKIMYPQCVKRRSKILLKADKRKIPLRLIRRNGDYLRLLGDLRKALAHLGKRHRRRDKAERYGASLRPLPVERIVQRKPRLERVHCTCKARTLCICAAHRFVNGNYPARSLDRRGKR